MVVCNCHRYHHHQDFQFHHHLNSPCQGLAMISVSILLIIVIIALIITIIIIPPAETVAGPTRQQRYQQLQHESRTIDSDGWHESHRKQKSSIAPWNYSVDLAAPEFQRVFQV